MSAASVDVFALSDSRKARAAFVADDERHFRAMAHARESATATLETRLRELRRAPTRSGEAALERDLDLHRLSGQRGLLRRFGLDLCLGRMTPIEGEPIYVGRAGMTDAAGTRLLVDWRAPAASPFFAATLADPQGLRSRRRYRWAGGRIVDFWDETLVAGGKADPGLVLDDQSAFLASLADVRTDRMRDVLTTIQSDQHAVIRAPAPGALVVDGGPGTGKTVVALHRAAYLLATDPHLGPGRGGVLFVGPSEAYLAHVDDVLPSLGEESVRVHTLKELVPRGRTTPEESDEIAGLKGRLGWPAVIDRAVAVWEQPPRVDLVVETPAGEVEVGAAEWAEAFAAAEPGADHNEARDQVWHALCEIVTDALDGDVPFSSVQRALARDEDVAAAMTSAWPLLVPDDVVRRLWSDPALLARCAPELTADERALLRRDPHAPWTDTDLPLLDAARERVGDAEGVRSRLRQSAEAAAESEVRARVADELIAADDSELLLMSMLRGQDVANALAGPQEAGGDPLRGPFAHVIVDEAQELTDAQWEMLVRRCPSRSFTVVGDRAQSRHPFRESWEERLTRVGLRHVSVTGLRVNYRTPAEIMREAEPIIRAVVPDANVPESVRSGGYGVERIGSGDVAATIADWQRRHPTAAACVIGDPGFPASARVASLSPATAKGLEFDLVVLVRPSEWEGGFGAAVDRYVAMTRTTRRLVVAD